MDNIQDKQSTRKSGYYGRPEKQRNPKAANFHSGKPSQPQKSRTSGAPVNIPKGINADVDYSYVTVSTESPLETSVFSFGASVREDDLKTEFTPSTPALIENSRAMYAELLTDNPDLGKRLVPEYLDYYSTSLVWFRIILLKQKHSQPLTLVETEVLTLLHSIPFVVPSPLYCQLKELGNIITQGHEHLYPAFPPLPTEVIGNLGGYYGILESAIDIDHSMHNLYEEIPCLGVVSYAIQQSISDAPIGRYDSNVVLEGQQPNSNLLGYKPLGFRRNEAKGLAGQQGISPIAFQCYPENTCINIGFLIGISNALATTKTFKNFDVVFTTLSESGSIVQVMTQHPVDITAGSSNLSGNIIPRSLLKETLASYGASIFLVPQLYKEPYIVNAVENHATWAMYQRIPPEWIQNRNIRREGLPLRYRSNVFSSVSQHGDPFRLHLVRSLVLVPR